ncbi:MAG: integrase arm-type DNA-binding domain-containing protein [Brevundimonas sp.]|uniref:tyrosine-type recombinase/integrase n=1 Tax=Brevundimonas sp. TaxID=1871086 RepID=UPI00300257FD
MARAVNRLNWKQVQSMDVPGLHADGNGLYLRIDETGSKRWVLIFQMNRKRREMGLGSATDRKLAEVRNDAEEARRLVRAGVDPIAARRAAALPPSDHAFSAVACGLMDDLEQTWRNPKSRAQWESSLKSHAPAIWNADVATVDTDMVLDALRPIWANKPETASRLRGRIERVLDAAKARGLRTGENPARWRGHLSILLIRGKRDRGHHAAMPYEAVPDFMAKLQARGGVSAQALRFLILTAARSGEVRGAVLSEMDGETWRIPGERMKGGRDHAVALSDHAKAVLQEIGQVPQSGLLFPGQNGTLSVMALTMLMRKMGVTGATPHGFRSSFRDWAGDCTSYPRELIEEALAHQVGNAVERAYRRRDALEKRRALMQAWAAFCMGEASGKVLAFPGA